MLTAAAAMDADYSGRSSETTATRNGQSMMTMIWATAAAKRQQSLITALLLRRSGLTTMIRRQ